MHFLRRPLRTQENQGDGGDGEDGEGAGTKAT